MLGVSSTPVMSSPGPETPPGGISGSYNKKHLHNKVCDTWACHRAKTSMYSELKRAKVLNCQNNPKYRLIASIQREGLLLPLFSLYLRGFWCSSKRGLKRPCKQVVELQGPCGIYSDLSVLLWAHLSTSATYDVSHSTAFQAGQLPIIRTPASGQGAV